MSLFQSKDMNVSSAIIQRDAIIGNRCSANIMATRELYTNTITTTDFISNGVSMVNDLMVINKKINQVQGGITGNGNFVIKSTTTLTDWGTNAPILHGAHLGAPVGSTSSLTGNRVGQLCVLYLHLIFENDYDLSSGIPLFSHIPASFAPGTQVSHPLTLECGDRSEIEYVTFNMNSSQAQLRSTRTIIPQNSTLYGTITYFNTTQD